MTDDIKTIIGQIKSVEANQNRAKLELSKFQGQLEQEMKRLKTDLELNNLDEANGELAKLEKKLDKIDNLIKDKYSQLKENYDVVS